MTDYTNLSDAVLTTGKPITQSIARVWRDNPIAIAEGSSGAPRIQTAALEQTPGAQAVTPSCVRPGPPSRALVTTAAGDVAWGMVTREMFDASPVVVLDRAAGTNAAGLGEHTIYSRSIPGGTLGTDKALRLTAWMRCTIASSSVTLRVKYGTTTYATFAAGQGLNSIRLRLESLLSANGAVNAQCAVSLCHFGALISDGESSEPFVLISDHGGIAQNSANALNLVLTVQGGTSAFSAYNIRVLLELL